MRHFWMALSLPCLLVVAAAAQAPAPKPGPEQKRLEVFVGNWTFEGEFSVPTMGQGGKVTGTENSQMLGGFFVERHFQEKGPGGGRRGVHIFGFDPVKKRYITADFDSTGGFGSGTVSVSGATWTFSETRVNGGKTFYNRCILTFAPGNRSFTVQCKGSTDKKKFAPSFKGKWTKAGQ